MRDGAIPAPPVPMAKGDKASDADKRIEAGYVSSPVPIHCATCVFVQMNFCQRWKFNVDPEKGCCNYWDNDAAINFALGRITP